MGFTSVPSVVTGQTYSAANYNTYVKDNINYLKDELDGQEPIQIGGLYFSSDATNPATSLGYGTWVAFGPGRTIVCYDASQTEFDTVGETGGEKTHALTAAENGEHDHNATVRGGTQNVDGGAQSATSIFTGTVTTTKSGSGTPHNNLQPYIVAYVWKRTA